MTSVCSAEAVVAFLHHFEELALQEDFDLLRDMIDERAYFRFNDGDFVGRQAIQAAFEKTWRGDPTVKKARFWLSDIVVLTVDRSSATATYTFHWEGSQGGRRFTIRGRGTRVLAHEGGRFRIVHEHLSRFPAGSA
jgi:ketosteroid isomerase-like protein